MKPSILLFLLFVTVSSLQGQWEDRRSNLPSGWGAAWAMDACDMNTAVVALGRGIWRTVDAGHSWQSLGWSLSKSPIDVAMPDKNHIWVASDSGKIYFWPGPEGTWQKQYDDTNVTTFMNYIEMFDTLNGIAMGDAIGSGLPALFLHTSDGGGHWTSVNDSSFGYFSGDLWRRLDFISPSTGYFFESGQAPQTIYKTTDGCAHWVALPLPDTVYVQVLKWYNDRIGLVKGFWWENPTVNGQVVARTLDGGSNWEVYDNSTMGWGADFEFVPGEPAKVWYTDDKGLYYSADTGRTWSRQRGQVFGRDIVFTDALHGWVLGDDTLLLYTSTGGITGVREDEPPVVSGFLLEQNYPNPFNPITIIKYTIGGNRGQGIGNRDAGAGGLGLGTRRTMLVVYDILGREVARLVDEPRMPGNYEVSFDGSGLSSGVYIYRLTSGTFAQTRAMLLVK